MADQPTLPLRMLRRGLVAASRAGASVVERVLRNDARAGPLPDLPASGGRPRMSRLGDGPPVKVRFGGTTVEVRPGTTVLDAARRHGVDLRSYCGGNCSCGTCRVEVVAGGRHLSRCESMEEMVLGPEKKRRGDRLACQAQVLGDVEIRIPEWF